MKQTETIQKLFQAETLKRTRSTLETWKAAEQHFQKFAQTKIGQGFEDDSPQTKIGQAFIEYLLKSCSHNSAATYYSKFKAVCIRGFEDGVLKTFKLPPINTQETHREHLSRDEAARLFNTPCTNPKLRKMALFSILTGLRWSDISELRWSDLRKSEFGWSIQFRQKKTGMTEFLPISENAIQILGEIETTQAKIFDISYSFRVSEVLKKWCSQAGIDRKITFHCFRHTHAVLQLEAGTDIFTLSKLLGHRDIKTTQIYAKISDKAKREAASRINLW